QVVRLFPGHRVGGWPAPRACCRPGCRPGPRAERCVLTAVPSRPGLCPPPLLVVAPHSYSSVPSVATDCHAVRTHPDLSTPHSRTAIRPALLCFGHACE